MTQTRTRTADTHSDRRARAEVRRVAPEKAALGGTASIARRVRLEAVLDAQVRGMPLRVPAIAVLAACAMLPVGLFLAALGVLALEISGGAAADTGLVVTTVALGVTDFWGGSLMYALTRRGAREVAAVWVLARALVLLLVVAVARDLAVVAPVSLALAAPAAWLGVRVGAKQAAMREAANGPAFGGATATVRHG